MIVCFQYKLYTTPEAAQSLWNTLEVCRHLYNNALAQRIDAYTHEGRTVTFAQQCRQLPLLKERAQLLADLYSQVAQDVLRRLDRTYQNFFRRVKQGLEKLGFPRFKGEGRYRSLCYPQWGSGVSLHNGLLRLSKIGEVAIRLHRPLQGAPKTCTITRKADGWYACIACEVEAEPLPETGREVGIDVGLEHFATFSDDTPPLANPRQMQQAQASLRKSQKRLERRARRDKNGKLLPRQSHRRDKAKVLLAKAHQRVARTRLDFLHKVVHDLLARYDTVYIEKLNIAGMLQNHHLARAIADAGWGMFFSVLKSQAARAVRRVMEVAPHRTSQNCCGCGEYVPKSLSCRTHSCPYCGLVLHRDVNAARNIHKKGRDAALSERAVVDALADLRTGSPGVYAWGAVTRV